MKVLGFFGRYGGGKGVVVILGGNYSVGLYFWEIFFSRTISRWKWGIFYKVKFFRKYSFFVFKGSFVWGVDYYICIKIYIEVYFIFWFFIY